ncbi:hypothetical protein KY335_00225, partial [Candidatus Woesearchaeota archaeon]|nr:hypothetical protein [Candidatus Woesearchaeota archaeon]
MVELMPMRNKGYDLSSLALFGLGAAVGAGVLMLLSLLLQSRRFDETINNMPELNPGFHLDAEGKYDRYCDGDDYKLEDVPLRTYRLHLPESIENPSDFISHALYAAKENPELLEKMYDWRDKVTTLNRKIESAERAQKEVRERLRSLQQNHKATLVEWADEKKRIAGLAEETKKDLENLKKALVKNATDIETLQQSYVILQQSVDQGPYFHSGITRSDIERFFSEEVQNYVWANLQNMGKDFSDQEAFRKMDYRIFMTLYSMRPESGPSSGYAVELKII